ncbi:MAG: efflux RND transporter periplasmic adaptor subunit [Steroidobacteraceae bacterium]
MSNPMSAGAASAATARALQRALTLVAVAAALVLAACTARSANGPDPASAVSSEVTLTPLQRQQIHLYSVAESQFRKTIAANAVVDYDDDQATSVLAPFSGPVARLMVSDGAQVRAGDALATVDSPDFASAISAYRKALATAQTARQLARLEQGLLQHRGIAPREAAQAQTDSANADADRDAALQALVALHIDPQSLKAIQEGRPTGRIEGVIRSPISGTVVERLITPGQLLQAGTTPCFTVADLSRVWVMAHIFGTDIDAVSRGDSVDVTSGGAGPTLSGTVTNIAAMVDPDSRSVIARVTVNNPGDILKKQMYVQVRIHARQQDRGLLVPVSAILRDDEDLPFVYISQPDGGFARRHVTLGYRAAERYDISAGLRPGDQVVVEGGIFLQFIQNQ